MPGEVGLIAKLLETVIGKVLDEDQIPELVKRHQLKKLKKECQDALDRNDWPAVADAVERLRALSSKP